MLLEATLPEREAVEGSSCQGTPFDTPNGYSGSGYISSIISWLQILLRATLPERKAVEGSIVQGRNCRVFRSGTLIKEPPSTGSGSGYAGRFAFLSVCVFMLLRTVTAPRSAAP